MSGQETWAVADSASAEPEPPAPADGAAPSGILRKIMAFVTCASSPTMPLCLGNDINNGFRK